MSHYQVFESSSNDGELFINLAFDPSGDIQCIAAPGVPLPFASAIFGPTSKYIGITSFTEGTMQVYAPLGYDVYMILDFWIAPSTVLFYYVNRATGVLDVQLYHQSAGGASYGGPNYFWDFSSVLFANEDAEKRFSADPEKYFSVFPALVEQYCQCL